MNILNKYLSILLSLILLGCKRETETNLNGYYGMSKYFETKNTNSDYIETFLLKIENNHVKIYGTVKNWGYKYKCELNKTKDTILLENNTKIYQKSNCDSIIYFETLIGNKILKTEYKKIPNLEKVVDQNGINSEKLSDLLSQMIISGKYKIKNKIINFKQNRKVENLEYFNNYKIIPRLGTHTNYDNRIIETENGIWKYEKKNDNLILTKYSINRDEYDMFILSDEKIELKKITCH